MKVEIWTFSVFLQLFNSLFLCSVNMYIFRLRRIFNEFRFQTDSVHGIESDIDSESLVY